MIKSTLRDYQAVASKFLVGKQYGVIGLKPGKGKTLISLTCIDKHVSGQQDFAVVFAPVKAYDREWGKEIKKHTNLKYIRLPELMEKATKYGKLNFLYEYDIVLVKYSEVKDYPSILPKICKGRITVFDECLQASTGIKLADGSTKRISEIVSKKLDIKVLSWNPETNKVEPKRVVNWFRNTPKIFYRVKTKKGGQRCCYASMNHTFYTYSGEKTLAEIHKGTVIYNYDLGLSKVQESVIVGSILGDGSIGFTSTGKARIRFVHSNKQKNWIFEKYMMLRNITKTPPKFESAVEGNYGEGYYTFNTLSSHNINRCIELFYMSGKKSITYESVRLIDELSLFVWFMDDGSLRYNNGSAVSMSLSTHGFTEKENIILIDYLKCEFDLFFILEEDKRIQKFYLRANKTTTSRFLDIISRYFRFSNNKFESLINIQELYSDEEAIYSLYEDYIVSIEKISDKLDTAYNIEVEDNHNFFAGGILVSNCHKLKNPDTQLSRFLKFATNESKAKWGLTATAIGNSVMDLWGLMEFFNDKVFGTEWEFKRHYCVLEDKIVGKNRDGTLKKVKEIVGHKNVDELVAIRNTFMYVLDSDLKIKYHEINYELTDEEDDIYLIAAQGILDKTHRDDDGNIINKGFAQRIPDIQRVTDGSRDENGNAVRNVRSSKYKAIFKEIEKMLLDGQSVIVFAEFIETFDMLSKLLYNDLLMLGNYPLYKIETKVPEFDLDKLPCVILLRGGGSESLNLGFANNVVMYSVPFNVRVFIQTVGRITRMDSEYLDNLHVWLPVCDKTVDLYKYKYLKVNSDLVNKIMGQEANLPEKKLTDERRDMMATLRKELLWRIKEVKKKSQNPR